LEGANVEKRKVRGLFREKAHINNIGFGKKGKEKNQKPNQKSGGSCRDRTCDPMITLPL
jgi:hypothetical protein